MFDDYKKRVYKRKNKLYDGVWVLPLLAVLYYIVSRLFFDQLYTSTVLVILAIMTFIILVIATVREGTTFGTKPEYKGMLVIDETDPEKDFFTIEVESSIFDTKDGDEIYLLVRRR